MHMIETLRNIIQAGRIDITALPYSGEWRESIQQRTYPSSINNIVNEFNHQSGLARCSNEGESRIGDHPYCIRQKIINKACIPTLP